MFHCLLVGIVVVDVVASLVSSNARWDWDSGLHCGMHVKDRACACQKSVLRLGVDKDHKTLNWVLILYQTCITTGMNCKQELQILLRSIRGSIVWNTRETRNIY